ncbi:MAG: HIT family hydrolase [Deltaproteobacteria bacterium RIFCSPLOWO2_02_FULL_44_10]|nr:MAG: HIT family hydrolase [Deltaproteobacteria bacterium RIFCSPLOWO2_02_FULL_44_10]
MSSIFSKIIRGEIPCHKLLEDDRYFSFLDIRPINPGHALVVPKKEIDYLFDLDDKLLADMMPFAKRVAKAIQQAVVCERIGIMVAGLEVPHAHLHLIPIQSLGDLTFARAKPASNDDLAKIAEKIRKFL